MNDLDKLRAAGAVETVGDILAGVGHNRPPEDAPIDGHRLNIDSIYEEARNWLDGTPIANQRQADDVTRLLDMAKKAGKAADEQREIEKKPHLEAGRVVDTAWKPLKERADKVVKGAQGALGAWLQAERVRLAAEAAEARRVADEEAAAALAASRAAQDSGDMAAMDSAEAGLEAAKAADEAARRAEKAKPIAKVEGMARGAGLRTVWDVALSDEKGADQALAKYMWQTQRARVVELYMDLAREAVRAGGRSIPGCLVSSREVVR
jgi:hypothetical protein